MQLSKPVRQPDGEETFNTGLLLNHEHIQQILDWGIKQVWIIETGLQDEQAEEREKILTAEFNDTYQRAIDSTKFFVEKVAIGKTIEKTEIEAPVVELMEKLLIDRDILFKLTGIYSLDNYLYSHSVNASVLALLIGSHLGFEKESLIQLGSSALMADIGMSLIPPSVYDHKNTLTEEQRDIIRQHPEHGVTVISQVKKIKEPVLEAVYQHHERYDGSGYPNSVDGNRISKFARIIAVADVFAAIREPRAHRDKSAPRRALKTLTSDQGFDPAVLRSLFATISLYPVQSVVRLNNGWVGIVVKVIENNPFRPVIKLIQDEEGNTIRLASRIDLSDKSNMNLYIEETLDEIPGTRD